MNEEKFMAIAIEEAYDGINRGDGGPFGVSIVKDGEVLARAHNTVLKENNPTCHAEINAISIAAKKCGTYDLTGCVTYSTTEPCPMCFAAIHWARIDRVVYGTHIEDAKRLGFHEMTISAPEMKRIGASGVDIRSGLMLEECQKLLEYWESLPTKKVY